LAGRFPFALAVNEAMKVATPSNEAETVEEALCVVGAPVLKLAVAGALVATEPVVVKVWALSTAPMKTTVALSVCDPRR
jgi:hypothetical protein